MKGTSTYTKWQEENKGKFWVSTEPCTIEFATEPWEGQFKYTCNGEFVQYRNGTWKTARQAGC